MHTHNIDRSEDSIMAVIPDIIQFNTGQPQKKDALRVPLFLVRIDGIIYSTGMTFTYAAEPGTFSTQNGQGTAMDLTPPPTAVIQSPLSLSLIHI